MSQTSIWPSPMLMTATPRARSGTFGEGAGWRRKKRNALPPENLISDTSSSIWAKDWKFSSLSGPVGLRAANDFWRFSLIWLAASLGKRFLLALVRLEMVSRQRLSSPRTSAKTSRFMVCCVLVDPTGSRISSPIPGMFRGFWESSTSGGGVAGVSWETANPGRPQVRVSIARAIRRGVRGFIGWVPFGFRVGSLVWFCCHFIRQDGVNRLTGQGGGLRLLSVVAPVGGRTV